MKKGSWKKLSSKVVHKNNWYSIRQDKVITPEGKKSEYNVIQRTPAVFILPINKTGEITLIKLYRYPTQMYSLEIPGGSSDNQKPLIAAKRELQEETGLVAKSWKFIGKFQVANGLMNEIGYVYLAQNLNTTSENKQFEEGIQKVITIPFKTALSMIEQGKITDGQTIVALNLARPFLK